MTDNEIIRCLRHCRSGDCENCKALNVCDATFSFHKEALDLINRQKAEIERLNEKITAKDENNYYFMGQLRLAREKLLIAKSKAIKEFAKRLKERLTGIGRSTTYGNFEYGTVISYEIDNLVKEMTEVNENEMPDMRK